MVSMECGWDAFFSSLISWSEQEFYCGPGEPCAELEMGVLLLDLVFHLEVAFGQYPGGALN